MSKLIALLTLCITIASCERTNSIKNNSSLILAYVPVYSKISDIENIVLQAPTPTVNAGKIYAYGNYIFQNDVQKGFHIINNTVPASAAKVAFMKVPFSTELAIKGNFLYCNNVSDLLVFNVSNPAAPQLVNRIKNAFPVINQKYPPITGTLFECVQPDSGLVVNWAQRQVPMPNCRR